MHDKTYPIEGCLQDSWLDAWVAEGLSALEIFLRNHTAFDSFLENREQEDSNT